MTKKIFIAICFSLVVISFSSFANDLDVLDKAAYEKVYSYLLIDKQDISIYKKIFSAQEDNNYKLADKYVQKLKGKHLMGHVLANKYLSDDYSSKLTELKKWLDLYPDLPQANKIYRLARRKGGKKSELNLPDIGRRPIARTSSGLGRLSRANYRFVTRNIRQFKIYVNRGKTKMAKNILENPKIRQLVPNKKYDELSTFLATKYLVDGEDVLAMKWTLKARNRSNNSMAFWIAGLANWRTQNYQDAATSFSRLLRTKQTDKWLLSASAYWAYRSYSKLGDKPLAKKYLRIASTYERTFYGILASYKRGVKINGNWSAISYLNDFNNYDYVSKLLESKAMSRAILLLHTKQKKLAREELLASYQYMSFKQQEAAIYVVNQYKMYNLAIKISDHIKSIDKDWVYDLISYPVPNWQPKNGWNVDKSLVLALVRQESGFAPRAHSPAGAKGLMQLLPNTAFHVTKDRSFKKNSTRLFNAEYNLELGQKYVSYLMEKKFIENNLFFMMTAYNAGPTNLVRWKKRADFDNDPLLFIEVIPARETRIYIERVMANYWMYNSRFGHFNPTLKALSQNKWPVIEY